ncbi:MAG TPA: transcription antitermination factor NusB, partial [Planctomycetes bacterium]|nr:transcription antitermination factor NusB [Planctomycetota bacterium]
FVEIADEVDGKDARRFSRDLVNGVRDQRAALDAELSAVAINWRVERMATIDRNILRIGAYELLFRDDVPAAVSINEAVTLAKKYSSKESGGFVNGILDKIRVRAEKGATVSAPAEEAE